MDPSPHGRAAVISRPVSGPTPKPHLYPAHVDGRRYLVGQLDESWCERPRLHELLAAGFRSVCGVDGELSRRDEYTVHPWLRVPARESPGPDGDLHHSRVDGVAPAVVDRIRLQRH